MSATGFILILKQSSAARVGIEASRKYWMPLRTGRRFDGGWRRCAYGDARWPCRIGRRCISPAAFCIFFDCAGRSERATSKRHAEFLDGARHDVQELNDLWLKRR